MKQAQDGATIIETLGAIAITSLMVVGLNSLIDTSMDDLKGQQAALHQSQIAKAARDYITANYASLVASTGGGTMASVTVAQLRTARHLPNSFSNTNAYQQTPCVLVRQPAAGKLDALIATYGGQAIPDRYVSMVAMQSGEGGGYITAANPSIARGSSWSLTTTPYRGAACGTTVLNGAANHDGGHLVSSVFYDGPGELSTEFLHRDVVAGRPELNQMNTPIRMDNAALVTSGADCRVGGVAVPGLAVDATTQQIVSCTSAGTWSAGSSWKESVASHGALPAGGNTVGDVRLARNIGRAFAYTASGWVPLAADQNNDLTVRDLRARDVLSTGRIDTSGTIHADGHISTDRDVNAAQDVRAGRDAIAGRDLYAARDAQVTRNVLADGVSAQTWMYSSAIQLGSFMQAGWACHYIGPFGQIEYPIGTVVVDQNGLVMSCASDRIFKYPNGTTVPNPP